MDKLILFMVVWFFGQANFCYCSSCLNIYFLRNWSKVTRKYSSSTFKSLSHPVVFEQIEMCNGMGEGVKSVSRVCLVKVFDHVQIILSSIINQTSIVRRLIHLQMTFLKYKFWKKNTFFWSNVNVNVNIFISKCLFIFVSKYCVQKCLVCISPYAGDFKLVRLG